MSDRLVHLGNVLVDVVAAVPALPARGADVLATSLGATVGGGFNLMSAAARQGVPVDYAGAHGTGPFGDLVRAALRRAGIAALCPPRPTDSAVVVVIVDGDGERTLLSSPVGVAGPTAAELAGVRPAAGDAVSLTGYGLLEPVSRAALLDWLPRLPAGVLVGLDPGPLAPSAQPAALAAVLARADWVSASAREAAELTGLADPERGGGRAGRPHPPGRAGPDRGRRLRAGRGRGGAGGRARRAGAAGGHHRGRRHAHRGVPGRAAVRPRRAGPPPAPPTPRPRSR